VRTVEARTVEAFVRVPRRGAATAQRRSEQARPTPTTQLLQVKHSQSQNGCKTPLRFAKRAARPVLTLRSLADLLTSAAWRCAACSGHILASRGACRGEPWPLRSRALCGARRCSLAGDGPALAQLSVFHGWRAGAGVTRGGRTRFDGQGRRQDQRQNSISAVSSTAFCGKREPPFTSRSTCASVSSQRSARSSGSCRS